MAAYRPNRPNPCPSAAPRRLGPAEPQQPGGHRPRHRRGHRRWSRLPPRSCRWPTPTSPPPPTACSCARSARATCSAPTSSAATSSRGSSGAPGQPRRRHRRHAVAAFFGSTIGSSPAISADHRQRADARHRHADGLSLHPAGAGHRRRLGPGLMNALYAIAIVNIPFFARNIRGVTLGLVAARVHRRGPALRQGRHPHPVLRAPAQRAAGDRHHHVDHGRLDDPRDRRALLPRPRRPAAAGRSRLDARRRARLLFNAPHVSVVPGVLIFLLVMSINLLGRRLRDVLDPRLKSGALSARARTEVELRAPALRPAGRPGRCSRSGARDRVPRRPAPC
jgi:hypothetical protein